MPARFRHAASQKMPMAALTDGSNTTAELPAAPEPVVSLLLPSAALHGVVTVADSERRPSSRAEDEIPEAECVSWVGSYMAMVCVSVCLLP